MKTFRSRTQNGLTLMPNMTAERRSAPGWGVTYSENTAYNVYSGAFKASEDYVTSGFVTEVKKGAIVNSPCGIRTSTTTQRRGSVTGEYFNGSSVIHTFTVNDLPLVRFLGPIVSGNSGYFDLVPTYGSNALQSVESLYAKAITSAYSKVRAPEMQSLVTLAELNKSVKLIGDTARKLANAIAAIRERKPDRIIARALGRPEARRQPHPIRYSKWDEDGNPMLKRQRNRPKSLNGKPSKSELYNTYGHSPRRTKESPHPISETSSLWLEWRYGWGPLVMDIVSALKALDKARGPRRFIARGLAKADLQSSSVKTRLTEGTAHYRVDVNQTRLARAYVLYEVSSELGALVNDFGVTDFPASAWELVPFSFVVDWFIPVGDWLAALTPKIGVNVLASGASFNEVIEVTRIVTQWQKNSPINSWDFKNLVGLSDSASTRAYERKVDVSVPMFPSTDVNVGIKRAVDAIALLSSGRSRK